MEALIRGGVGPAVKLHYSFNEQPWPTFLDPPQLESALLNLCLNARAALPDGGKVLLHGENLSLDLQRAQALGLLPGDYLHLSVEDNGLGMSPQVLAQAIDPFFTTKPMGQGTGLGLSMVYGFVRQSGGQLQIGSTQGQGHG